MTSPGDARNVVSGESSQWGNVWLFEVGVDTMRTVSKTLVVWLILLYFACLSGCATTADVDALRLEIASANARADEVVADMTKIRRELESSRAADVAGGTSNPKNQDKPDSTPRESGYKWGAKTDPDTY